MSGTAAPATSRVDTTAATVDSSQFTADRVSTPLVDAYVARITPWQSVNARFVATVTTQVQPYADQQAVTSALPLAFDLDYAIGVQLDAVGMWVGLARTVPVPLPNTFFSLGSDRLGLGRGYWKGPYDSGTGVSVLSDDLYRNLLRAKVAANSWDGSAPSLLPILRNYFTDLSVRIIIDDHCRGVQPILYFALGDANRGLGRGVIKGPISQGPASLGYALTIGFAGTIPPQIDLSILAANLIPLNAMGAATKILVTTASSAPLFGLGSDNANVAGLGKGAWGASPAFVSTLAVGTYGNVAVNAPGTTLDVSRSVF